MQRIALTVVFAGALALIGCNDNKAKSDLADVPPPANDPLFNVPPPAPEPVLTSAPAPATTIQAYQPATAQPTTLPGRGTSYIVRRGDTLWSIAQRSYGSGQKWQQIASANGISDPTKLRVGQTLVLP